GRFEPELRDQGMLAIGARTQNVTDSGLQAYDEIARSVAMQVVDGRHRASLVGCTPRSQTSPDDACARSFFARVEPLLFRRPLTDEEVELNVKVAAAATTAVHDFYVGLADSLAEVLISPDF